MPLVVQPRSDNPRRFERELTQWWRQYNAYWRQQRAEDNQPPLVSTYLTAMLAQRLGLEPPLLERLQAKEASATTTQSLELMLGMERLRLEALKNTMLGRGDFGEVANLPLPAEPAWSPLAVAARNAAAAEIEPIALHVPPDWFYVRFGRFSNYLWLNHLLEEYGGDISSMVTLRSYVAPMNKRVQNQLGLEQNVLGELLRRPGHFGRGPGRPRHVQPRRRGDGHSVSGDQHADFEERSIAAARSGACARAKEQGAAAETLQIAGREVSFYLHARQSAAVVLCGRWRFSPGDHVAGDGRAVFGPQGRPRLARRIRLSFAHARRAMPLSRSDTVFVYFSSAFFEGLFSPQYQVELQRGG